MSRLFVAACCVSVGVAIDVAREAPRHIRVEKASSASTAMQIDSTGHITAAPERHCCIKSKKLFYQGGHVLFESGVFFSCSNVPCSGDYMAVSGHVCKEGMATGIESGLRADPVNGFTEQCSCEAAAAEPNTGPGTATERDAGHHGERHHGGSRYSRRHHAGRAEAETAAEATADAETEAEADAAAEADAHAEAEAKEDAAADAEAETEAEAEADAAADAKAETTAEHPHEHHHGRHHGRHHGHQHGHHRGHQHGELRDDEEKGFEASGFDGSEFNSLAEVSAAGVRRGKPYLSDEFLASRAWRRHDARGKLATRRAHNPGVETVIEPHCCVRTLVDEHRTEVIFECKEGQCQEGFHDTAGHHCEAAYGMYVGGGGSLNVTDDCFCKDYSPDTPPLPTDVEEGTG